MSKSSRQKGYGALDSGSTTRKLEITVISAAPMSEVGFRDAVKDTAKENLLVDNIGNGKAPLLPQSKSSGSLSSLLGRAAGGSGTSSRNSRAGSIEDLVDMDNGFNVLQRRGPTIIRVAASTNPRSNGDLTASAIENPAFRMESNKNRAAPAPPCKAPAGVPARVDTTKRLTPSCPPPRPKEPPRVIAETKVETPVTSNLINFDFEAVQKMGETTFYLSKSDLMTGSPPPLTTKALPALGRPYGVALFDYKSTMENDLSFSVGDVILIERHLYDGWCFGYTQDGHGGNCPINYLDIRHPLTSVSGTDFAVSSTLAHIGSSSDEMLFATKIGDRERLMSTEHVPMPLERNSALSHTKPPLLTVKPQLPLKPPRALSNIVCENINENNIKFEAPASKSQETLPSQETLSSSLPLVQSVDSNFSNASTVCGSRVDLSGPRCTAIFDYDSMEPGDLSFKCGDVIALLSHHGEDWLEGKLWSIQGIFPASFVRIDEDLSCSQVSSEKLVVQTKAFDAPCSAEKNQLYLVKALYAYGGIDGDLTFEANDLISVIEERGEWLFGSLLKNKDSWVTGIFPANFVEKVKGPIADVIFDFEAEFDNELSLLSGEVVLSVCQINDDWFSGELADGRTGIFPQRFVHLRS